MKNSNDLIALLHDLPDVIVDQILLSDTNIRSIASTRLISTYFKHRIDNNLQHNIFTHVTNCFFTSICSTIDSTHLKEADKDQLKKILMIDLHHKTFNFYQNKGHHFNSTTFIEKIQADLNDPVLHLNIDTTIDPKHKLFLECAALGLVGLSARLLQMKDIDPSVSKNYALRLAAMNGHPKMVALLLKDTRVNPAVLDNVAIGLASQYGHLTVVKLLLQDKRVKPGDADNYAILKAAKNKYKEIVIILLQHKLKNNVDLNLEQLKNSYDDRITELETFSDALNEIKKEHLEQKCNHTTPLSFMPPIATDISQALTPQQYESSDVYLYHGPLKKKALA